MTEETKTVATATVETTPTPLTDAQLREALTKMHIGLVTMQARLDDHEKVIEKLITGMSNIAETMAPQKGFRTPKKDS